MIIDFRTHAYPPEDQAHPFWRGRCPLTIENILEAQEIGGVDRTVVSNPFHELRSMDRHQQLDNVERMNRYLASLQDKHETIYAFATTVPCGGDAFLKELERSVREDGLKGVWIMSSLQGHYPDDDEALPFFRLVTELDIPVVVHPPAVGFGEERLREYRLASSVGRPMDNALALSRLIVRGIFEKFPTLKLVGSHLGGGICEMIGRMDYAYNLRDEAYFLGPYEPLLIKHPPSHYLKMMHLESTFGVDHFIFGTDAPPLKSLKAEGVQLVKKLGLSAEDEEKVYSGNARKLLKI